MWNSWPFFPFHSVGRGVEQLAAGTGLSFFPDAPTAVETSFFQLCSSDERGQTVNMTRCQDMLAGMVRFPFLVLLVGLPQLCTQFGRFAQPL